jgi:hypothetical protein
MSIDKVEKKEHESKVCKVDYSKSQYEMIYRLLANSHGIQHLYLHPNMYPREFEKGIVEFEMKLVTMKYRACMDNLTKDVLTEEEIKEGWVLARLEHLLAYLIGSERHDLFFPGSSIMAAGSISVHYSGRFRYINCPYISICKGKVYTSDKKVARSGECFEEGPYWEGNSVLVVREVK